MRAWLTLSDRCGVRRRSGNGAAADALTRPATSDQSFIHPRPIVGPSSTRKTLAVAPPLPHHADLQAALRRLSGAVDLLEAAAERLDLMEAERRDLDAVLAAMEDDRGRLAEELDTALKTRRALAAAAEEVADRLHGAGDAMRVLLQAQPAGAGVDAAARDGVGA